MESVDGSDLVCKVETSGTVSDHKGCNIPSGNLSVEVVTEKDEKDLEFIASLDPEYVAASFVGSAEDVEKVYLCASPPLTPYTCLSQYVCMRVPPVVLPELRKM